MKIIFDLDGTLLDVEGRFYRIYSEILQRYGFKLLSGKTYWTYRRQHYSTAVIIKKTCPEDFIATFYQERNRIFEQGNYLKYDRLRAEALRILNYFYKNYPIYLLTLRNNRKNLKIELNEKKIFNFFKAIITGDPFGDWTLKYRLIKDRIKVKPKEALIIGDTEIDIEAGRELGIYTCAITTGLRNKDLIKQTKPDFIIENLLELESIMDEIRGMK
jgi:phosphoglycolate phosphatase-like HAD superfamily hydrolase